MNIIGILGWILRNGVNILTVLSAVFGLLTAIVKVCPTLNNGWLLNIIKLIGNITNRQTDDNTIRASRNLTSTKAK